MREWTPLIIVCIPLALGLLDVVLYWLGGNEATISMVMLQARVSSPLSALATVYTFGLLIGHLYFPNFTLFPPPAHLVVARMFVALSPIFYGMTIIGFGNGANTAHTQILDSGGELSFAGYVLAAFIFGGLIGRFVLCQHVAPLPNPGA